MKQLGQFCIEHEKLKLEIDLETLVVGFNNLKDYIINVGHNKEILYVIDKICNHAGGKLIVKGDKAVCPMHNWHLDLESLKYNNTHVCKEPVGYIHTESGSI
jgi:CMP-N-acetylneuraminate monooxygenase